jgi:hypothetical protein
LTFPLGWKVDDGGVEVRLLYFDDCPNWRHADTRLREALADRETPVEVGYQLVRSAEEAERAGFRRSPTILINGRDPFASPGDPVGLACRIYRTPNGVEPAPTVEQLRAALVDADGR